MQKLVIYGVGKGFKEVNFAGFWQYLEKKYEIIAVVDGNSDLKGKEIYIGGRKYELVISSKTFWLSNFNCHVYITANNFFDEIRKELLERGVIPEHILEKNFLRNEYLSSKFQKKYISGMGIEVGGPSSIFNLIYNSCASCDDIDFAFETIWNVNNLTDIFVLKDGTVLGKRYKAEATDMHLIKSETYDFVLSSNNIEHIANPLKAISEFIRILKKGGSIIMVVPNKIFNFDHKREDTLFGHIMEDYDKNVGENDLSHLGEILEKHDLDMDIEMTFDEFKKRSLNNYYNRCLHHHVFSTKLLEDIAKYFGLNIKESGEVFSDFYMIAVKP